MRIGMFSNCWKIDVDFRNATRKRKKIFFQIIVFELVTMILSLLQRKKLSSAVNASKSSPEVSHITNSDIFQLHLPIVDEKIWTEVFRHWSNQVFGNMYFRKKTNYESRNGAKNWENVFCFADNYIWIGYGKFSPLQRKYLSSRVNVLTNSLKISHVTNKDIFQLKFPQSDKKYDRSAVMQISQVFRHF